MKSAPLVHILKATVGRRSAPPVLSDVSVSVHAEDRIALVGPNGVGKSTLLLTLCGVLRVQDGARELVGRPFDTIPGRERAKTIAMMTQRMDVQAELTVNELCLLGRAPHMGKWGIPGAADRHSVERSLAAMGLLELRDRSLRTLSGGERQRAWFASLLAQDAPVMLLDEPFSAQDPDGVQAMLLALRSHAAEGGASIVALHDLALASRHFDRVWVLGGGEVAFDGDPRSEGFGSCLRSLYGDAVEMLPTDDGPLVVQRVPT